MRKRATTPADQFLTVGQLAERFSIPEWLARRVVDALGADVPRAGLYRLVPRSLLGKIEAELRRRGYVSAARERETATA
jgi:hypothetical protein